MSPFALDLATIRRAPKVLLHEHLDGGLRPSTLIELADEIGYTALPTRDPEELAAWFKPVPGEGGRSLVRYLQAFDHTVAVMQTAANIERVAAEEVEDLAADGIVYAEVRFAPEQHLREGLTLDQVVEAAAAGVRRASEGRPIVVGLLLSAMRQAARSVEIAELAVRHREAGVLGFDVAGPEAGYPPTRYLDAFQLIAHENFHFTIHAGEAFGLPSIWEALQFCGAERLGHGVRIVDDIVTQSDGRIAMGRLAAYVRDRRIPLEMCPTSNIDTGAVARLEDHPINLLKRLRFRVTLNTDNRLMSNISLSDEFASMVATFVWDLADMEWVTLNAIKSAFLPFDGRLRIINEQVKPGYARLRAEASSPDITVG